ncbi:hypothetical protein K8352_11185 [Flavobacteriaceae bacterium F89]|uniref:Uncharacterized protein n=1 Tax=Cerina litoralis TaxID=2874477 RepID=A0AAE3EW17_9FLAO|nr:hypothetical protein [Cerina litoralis]MCG2461313.1 hypothetical protein [Cerina litoralis]
MDWKVLFFGLVALVFNSCKEENSNPQVDENRIANMEKKLESTYKPGLGELMSFIQLHHAKLWYAGINNNWKLTEFELTEINEALEDIKSYNADRPEIKEIGIIEPALQNVSKAIMQKNSKQFEESFTELTVSCNTCHVATDHGYIVIKTPDSPPFSNQDFRVK